MFWRKLGAGQYSFELSPEATVFLEGVQKWAAEDMPPGQHGSNGYERFGLIPSYPPGVIRAISYQFQLT